jgi:glycosyltransferase involved in cell wall biosynthesis
MRVLLINGCHYRRGGADVVYLNTIQLLREKGHEVIAFSSANEKNLIDPYTPYFVSSPEFYNLSFIKKLQVAPRSVYSIEASRKLEALIAETHPEVAHIHLYRGVLTGSVLRVLKKNKIPVVVTLHDFNLLCPRSVLLDGKNRICEKCIGSTTVHCIISRCNRGNLLYSAMSFLEYNFSKFFFRPESYIDSFISVSKFNYEKHRQQKSLAGKLVHLYNFSPAQLISGQGTGQGSYFLYCGRLIPGKGLETLFNACKMAGEAIQLVVVGTGELEEALKAKLVADKIRNIRMIGFKEGKELQKIISDACCIVIPSELYENNPMVIVEGYATGKPVIGSRIGGIPEVVQEGITGYTYEMGNFQELANKMITIARLSPGEYERLSGNALMFAETHFSEENHYSKLISIYKGVKIAK